MKVFRIRLRKSGEWVGSGLREGTQAPKCWATLGQARAALNQAKGFYRDGRPLYEIVEFSLVEVGPVNTQAASPAVTDADG